LLNSNKLLCADHDAPLCEPGTRLVMSLTVIFKFQLNFEFQLRQKNELASLR